ncbi:MAG: Nif3-like dinuclear metal center hexameric protein [Rikenellaceae bacterium]
MMTRVADVAAAIEEFAPLALQASFDNSGLIVGCPDDEVQGVLLAVDLTEEVIEEAVSMGANMVITHHPIIFNPLKRLNSANCVERCVEMAIRAGVVIYAAHTNLDSAQDGMSWRLGEMLSLHSMERLDDDEGYGVVGDLSAEVDCREFIDQVAARLGLEMVRHSAISSQRIDRVAICTGSGGSLLKAAISKGADLYITADLRYNDFFAAQRELTIVDVGHYESEYCAIEIIYDILSKKMFNFALHKSLRGENPVHYRTYVDRV